MLSTTMLCKRITIPRERLRDWMVRGFIAPTVKSKKQGNASLFNVYAIMGVLLFDKLISSGFKRHAAAHIVRRVVELKSTHSVCVYYMENEEIDVRSSGVGRPSHYYMKSRIWVKDLYVKALEIHRM